MAEISEKAVLQSEINEPSSLESHEIPTEGRIFTHDEYHLATLGYKQEFIRSLGFFESWAAVLTR